MTTDRQRYRRQIQKNERFSNSGNYEAGTKDRRQTIKKRE